MAWIYTYPLSVFWVCFTMARVSWGASRPFSVAPSWFLRSCKAEADQLLQTGQQEQLGSYYQYLLLAAKELQARSKKGIV